MGNEYQQAISKIAGRMTSEVAELLARARASGHFPDDPGEVNDVGDPINRQIARAERKAYEAFALLGEIRGLLHADSLHEANISI